MVFIYLCFFEVSLCILGWPVIQYVDQALNSEPPLPPKCRDMKAYTTMFSIKRNLSQALEDHTFNPSNAGKGRWFSVNLRPA